MVWLSALGELPIEKPICVAFPQRFGLGTCHALRIPLQSGGWQTPAANGGSTQFQQGLNLADAICIYDNVVYTFIYSTEILYTKQLLQKDKLYCGQVPGQTKDSHLCQETKKKKEREIGLCFGLHSHVSNA